MILSKVNQSNLIDILKTNYVGSTRISSRDKLVLVAVFSFADYGNNGFYGSPEHLEPQVGSSAKLIKQSLSKLEKIGVLKKTPKNGLVVDLNK
jgi:hypothetical protein